MSARWVSWVAVAMGSALGALLRAGLDGSIPFGIVVANGLGAFAIGWYAAWRGTGAMRPVDHLVMDGLCAGFTTFSLFSLESLRLLDGGAHYAALGNVMGTLVLALLGVAAGWRLGRRAPDGVAS